MAKARTKSKRGKILYDGRYVVGREGPRGMIITATREGREEAREAEGTRDAQSVFVNMFEDWIANEWAWIPPESIGALTDGEIISPDAHVDGDGSIVFDTKQPRIYWFSDYAVVDPLGQWAKGKEITFDSAKVKVENNPKRPATAKGGRAKKHGSTITIDDLTDSIGASKLEEVWQELDESGGETHNHAYSDALYRGMSEEEAYEEAREAESREVDEQASRYIDAVESAADYLYGKHKLIVVIPTKRVDGQDVRLLDRISVGPVYTWRDAAQELMETINGVRMFHFSSVQEFLDSGPYTPMEAVMSHLRWIKRYPDVYGGRTASRMIEDSWR